MSWITDPACREMKEIRARRKQEKQDRLDKRQRELDRREQLKREIAGIRWRA